MRIAVFRVLLFLFLFPLAQKSIAQEKGWIKFDFNVDYIYVLIEEETTSDEVDVYYVTPGDSIEVSTGLKKMRITYQFMIDELSEAIVEAGKTSYKFFNFSNFGRKIPNSFRNAASEYNVLIHTEPNGEIYVNGIKKGKGMAQLYLTNNRHSVEIRHPDYGDLKFDVSPKNYINRTYGYYNRNPHDRSLAFKFLPAGAFISNKEHVKTGLTLAGFAFLTYLFIDNNNRYNELESELNELQSNYLSARTSNSAIIWRETIERSGLTSDLSQLNDERLYLIGSAVLWHGLTTYLGFKKPTRGYISYDLAPSFSQMLTAKVNF